VQISDALSIILALFSTETIIGALVALIGGWLWKKNPAFANRLIPIFTFAVALLTQFVNYFTGQPPSAPVPAAADTTIGMLAAPTPYLQAGFFDGSLFKVLVTAVLQWLATDKFYESQKKAVVGFKEVIDGVPAAKSQV
jgi:peptidoglycan/LPS O-acetylase OafA/YrhL